MNLGNQYGEYAIESGQTMRCKRPSKATASAASRLQSSTPQCNGATARVEKARSSSCFWLHCNMDRVGPVHLGHSSDDAALRIKIASPGAMLFGNVSCAKQVSAEALGYYSDVKRRRGRELWRDLFDLATDSTPKRCCSSSSTCSRLAAAER